MSERKGDWMQTANGGKFFPLDPRAEDVDIQDIAHALSHLCRFGGHCRSWYSVAEHSVRVSLRVMQLDPRPSVALSALLHDASEAYLGDMIRPLKRSVEMTAYRMAENNVMLAICERFGIPYPNLGAIRQADEELLATEARDIMGGQSEGRWCLVAEPLSDPIHPWAPNDARTMFLEQFRHLGGKP